MENTKKATGTVPVPESIAATLERIRNLLARPNGWIKGSFVRAVWVDDGERMIEAYCSIGAINYGIAAMRTAGGRRIVDANSDNNEYWRTINMRQERKDEVCGYVRQAGLVGEMAEWNDARDRSQDEVIALFDKALALAEADAA